VKGRGAVRHLKQGGKKRRLDFEIRETICQGGAKGAKGKKKVFFKMISKKKRTPLKGQLGAGRGEFAKQGGGKQTQGNDRGRHTQITGRTETQEGLQERKRGIKIRNNTI